VGLESKVGFGRRPSGKRLGSHVVETNARALIEMLRKIPRNRYVGVEQGTLSGWL
jgi:hypothetical protein